MKRNSIKSIQTVSYSKYSLPTDTKSDWKRVDAMTAKQLEDNRLSDPDTLFADEAFWKTAKWAIPNGRIKERITIRLDEDVLDWLRGQGRGYQSRINALLRAYMGAVHH